MSRVEKYLPFDALEGYRQEIDKKRMDNLKINRPILSEDQIEEINNNLIAGFNKKISLTYYDFGYIRKINNCLRKVDAVYIYLDTLKIKKEDVLLVEIVV